MMLTLLTAQEQDVAILTKSRRIAGQRARVEMQNRRPKKTALTDAYRNLLPQPYPGDSKGRTYADKIAEAMVRSAINGKAEAAREIANRAEGLPVRTIPDEDEITQINFIVKLNTDPSTTESTDTNPAGGRDSKI